LARTILQRKNAVLGAIERDREGRSSKYCSAYETRHRRHFDHIAFKDPEESYSDWLSGGGLMTAGANRRGTLARTHRDLAALVIGAETSPLVNESPETVTAV
jgi:hypothetical protein